MTTATIPTEPAAEERLAYISVGRLLPSTDNPRRKLVALEDLVASVKVHGIINPLIVEQIGGNYRIIAGHRRHAAAKQAGLAMVPCIVRRFDGHTRFPAMLIDNVQRAQLDPVDEALAYNRLREEGLTQAEIARLVGVSQTTISVKLQLLELSKSEQRAVRRGDVNAYEALGYHGEKCPACKRYLPKGTKPGRKPAA